MSRLSEWWRSWEITIDSNWIITVGMALLFAFVAFLLGWSIRSLLLDRVHYGVSQGARGGSVDTLTYALGAVYFFLFAYSFPAKHVKVAFLLLGAKYSALVAAPYSHAGAVVQHRVTVAESIASQIAYTIILFAIAQWFRSVVHWTKLSDQRVTDS